MILPQLIVEIWRTLKVDFDYADKWKDFLQVWWVHYLMQLIEDTEDMSPENTKIKVNELIDIIRTLRIRVS